MLNNYLKIAWRTLVRNKLYTTLNVLGLTFGISCFLLIGLYLFDELTFDQQHSQADRIYRVIEHKNTKGEALTIAAASYKLAEESKKGIAEIEATTRISRIGRANILNPDNQIKFQENVTVADENFLKIFDFPLLLGDEKTALQEPNSILVTEDLAQKLFQSKQVLGKTLRFSFHDAPLTVTGVLKNHQPNSTMNFSSIVSDASFTNTDNYKEMLAGDWSSHYFTVYALLKPNAEATEVSKKITQLIHANFQPEVGTTVAYSLQPLKDLHLYSENIVDGARNSNVEAIAQGNPLYIRIFAIAGLFVLLIACINYMNLMTARASNRAKEIGVRKTVGAFRSHLTNQFLFESLLVTGISFVLSVALVNLLLPAFNQFANKQLSLGFGTDYRIWLSTIGIMLIAGLLSGSYPALLLSRFHPALLLKGAQVHHKGALSLRKGLVVFQFAISIVMIIATIVLFQQVRYLNSTDLGFNKELLVVVDVNSGKVRKGADLIKAEMSKIPTVKGVSITSRVPGEWKQIRSVKIKNQGNTEDHKTAYLIGADQDFSKTFEVKLLKGRNFSGLQDSSAILINEAAAKMLNITELSDQMVEIPSLAATGGNYNPVNEDLSPFTPRIIGIVKDFHFQSLREKIAPMVLAYYHNPVHGLDYFTARIEAHDIPATLEQLKAVMVSVDNTDPFEYHFLDEQLAHFYTEDQRRQTLLIWMALVTIFIACLGLFGLATYAAEQRVKEIGVRKVLGASATHLAGLLSRDFLKLVLIANGLAFPLAWWATDRWLQEFAYHIDVKWWVFVAAGLAAVLIALITVSVQSVKAALANPVQSLRSE